MLHKLKDNSFASVGEALFERLQSIYQPTQFNCLIDHFQSIYQKLLFSSGFELAAYYSQFAKINSVFAMMFYKQSMLLVCFPNLYFTIV